MDDGNRRCEKWWAALLGLVGLLVCLLVIGGREASEGSWTECGPGGNLTGSFGSLEKSGAGAPSIQAGMVNEADLLLAARAKAPTDRPPDAAKKKSPQELIDNPDFEDADPQAPDRIRSWEPIIARGGAVADDSATYAWEKHSSHTGQKSVKISKSSEEKMAGVTQQVACPSTGGWYQLTAWLRTRDMMARPGVGGGANLTVRCQVAGLDAPLSFGSPLVSSTQNWQQQKLIFVVPEGCRQMTVILGLQGVKGTVWWDDVSLKEISPPKGMGREKMAAGDLDRYGGYKKIKGRKTGFFHTQQINGRWWLITPDGHGFIAVGLQCMFRKGREAREVERVRNVPTQPADMEERFELLTQVAQAAAQNHNLRLDDVLPRNQRQEIKTLMAAGDPRAPEKINAAFSRLGELIHRSSDQQQWLQASADRLKSWGFNLVSHNVLFKKMVYDLAASPSLWGFPFIAPEVWVPARIGKPVGQRRDNPAELFGFPDVFDPKFNTIFEQEFKKIAARVKDDPYLLGYFLGNELAWGGNQFNPSLDQSLFDMFLALAPERPGKQAAVEFLRQQYNNNPQSFAETWGRPIKNFDELLPVQKLGPGVDPAACRRDRAAFLRLAAEKYFQTGHAIIKKYDPHHLILGVRFIGVHSVPREVLETIGRYVDVVSFNAYDLLPPLEALEQTYAIHHKPMLITEFSFKAMDSGLRNTLGQGFLLKTQKDRALWYERYVARLLSSPHLVGFIWYKDVDDQPFEKGENCNYGLMARDGVPYAPFVAKVREVNRRVYPIAAGAREK